MAVEMVERILKHLQENGIVDTLRIAELWKEDHQKIVGAVKSLQSLGDIIEAELQSTTQWILTDEGKLVAEHGSHEAVVYHSVPCDSGISQSELMAKVVNAKVGFSKAMALGWIQLDKTHSSGPRIYRKVEKIDDVVQQHLKNLVAKQDSLNSQLKQEYKKRKLIQEIVIKSYILKPGPSFSTSISKQETDLTPEMIATGAWKEKQFKPYNLDALGTPIIRGHLHPLLKVRAEFRQIFLEMGFTEMPTNNYVESSFWNFDALFQPQQHPARDAHDTFFLSDPAAATDIPQDFMEQVKQVHSIGGYGSVGYGYEWKIEEAKKNLMRTHTTAVSARMLYALAQKEFKPMKYFSIDRVFRNETLDATHLAEFHQIEGVVADYGLTLGDLIGVLYEFFRKLGIEKLRFKPAYNPYTEPSMEIFSYHPGLRKWVEVGNSGLFRPEMLLPMGLPEGVSVIAWGLSLERPTMIKYGLDNIRDLVGHRVNLQMVADNPICRLDKHRSTTKDDSKNWNVLEQRIDLIINQLKNVQSKVDDLRGCLIPQCINLVIDADPRYPPYSIPVLVGLLHSQGINVQCTTYKHSTLLEPLPNLFKEWLLFNGEELKCSESKVILKLAWIWKPVGHVPKLRSIDHSGEMQGECTIARLLARILECSTHMQLYEKMGTHSAEIDEWIDVVEAGLNSKAALTGTSKRIEQRLKNSDWLIGPGRGQLSLCDIVVAALLRDRLQSEKLKEWFTNCLSC